MEFAQKWLPDLLAVVGLGTAVLIFFWPVVSGQAWIPRGGGDLVSFVYPMIRFAAQSLHHGELPLWNPFLYAGAPFLADNQSGLFYPPNLLLFLLNPHPSYRAVEGLVLFHFWLAGTNLYLCLRGWRRQNRIAILPAMLGALAFMFSDLFITHIGNLNLNAVIAWLPLALLALHRAIEAVGWQAQLRWALLGGLVVSVSTLAGHGQMTFMVGIFLACYGLYRAVVGWNGRPLIHLAIIGVVGMAGAALALLPAVLLIPTPCAPPSTLPNRPTTRCRWKGWWACWYLTFTAVASWAFGATGRGWRRVMRACCPGCWPHCPLSWAKRARRSFCPGRAALFAVGAGR